MPTNCVITFDHLDGIYKSGDTINGHIQLQTIKTKSIRAIYITVEGYADVEWKERGSHTNKGQSNWIYYKAHEQYLSSVTYVVGRDCGDSFDLLPGIYEYTFNCALPINLPTSCDTEYGKIKYAVSITINRRFRFNNIFSKSFKVNHILDLNLNLLNRLPASVNGATEIGDQCCFCCVGGNVRATLKIPFAGAIRSQTIPIQLFVNNDSNVDIDNCKVKLKKVVTFESTTPSTNCKHISIDLDTKLVGSVLRLSHQKFNRILRIPPNLPCTQLRRCIRIEYYIKATIDMGFCTNNIEIQIPITIGSIPFLEETRHFNELPMTTQPTAPSLSVTREINNLAPPPVYKSSDLPSYEEAVELIND